MSHDVVLGQAIRQALSVLDKHGTEAWLLRTDIGKAQPTRGPNRSVPVFCPVRAHLTSTACNLDTRFRIELVSPSLRQVLLRHEYVLTMANILSGDIMEKFMAVILAFNMAWSSMNSDK